MSRDGFIIADISVGLLHHRRLRKLRHDLGELEAAALSTIWLELVLASWADGERLTLAEIDAPAAVTDERTEALRAAGLVDAAGRVPASTWRAWWQPAFERREGKRAGGRLGARRRWQSNGSAGPEPMADPMADPIGEPDTEILAEPMPADRLPPAAGRRGSREAESKRAPAREFDAPARFEPKPTPSPSAIYCLDYSAHRVEHHWWPGIGWKCSTCEKAKADVEPTFREKLMSAEDKLEREDPF